MFFAAFGGAWLALWGYNEFTPSVLVLSIVALGTVALLAWSIRIYRHNAEALRIDGQTPLARRRSRMFNLINAVQWVVIIALAILLGRMHLQTLILPTVIFVVGLHFLPLAKLFAYRPHYITGVALVTLALTYPLLSSEGPQSALGALGAGVILWLSAVWALLPGSTVEAQVH